MIKFLKDLLIVVLMVNTILAPIPAYAVLSAGAVGEVWSTGASTNGGCFDPTVGVPGTDYSFSTTPQVAFTDLVIGTTTTQATSVLNPITDAMVGNCVNVVSGAGCTVARSVLISQTGGTGVFNTSLGTAASVCTANLGGAVDTLTRLTVVSGNTVYVKATGTYGITATQTFAVNGTDTLPITFTGYTNTRGDGGQVTVQRSSGTTVTLFSVTGTFRRFNNFIADCNTTGTTIKGFSFGARNITMTKIKAMNCVTDGVEVVSSAEQGLCIDCWVTGTITGGSGGFFVTGSADLFTCIGCQSTSNATHGFVNNSASGATVSRITFLRSISANNTGEGFKAMNTAPTTCNGCIAYGNTGNGLLFDTTASATAADSAQVLNSVFVNNGAYGISSNGVNFATASTSVLAMNYNAFFGNTTDDINNVAAGANDITLTADPFTSSTVFTLNATGLTELAGLGFPGVLQTGGTGYLTPGALEPPHSGSGGGGGTWIAKVLIPLEVFPINCPEWNCGTTPNALGK